MSWIKIIKGDKSTLPKPEVPVYVCINKFGLKEVKIAELTEEGKWFIPYKELADVTHWQKIELPND